METLWQTQRRSAACGLLSGVFLVTAVVLSRRISGDAGTFSSELAACLTGVAASMVGILAASLPDLVSVQLARPQRTLLISACGLPGIMLGLAVMPAGSSTGLACLLGLYVAAVLTSSAQVDQQRRDFKSRIRLSFMPETKSDLSQARRTN